MNAVTRATREAALRPTPCRYREIFVPEQGLTYRLRSITEAERQYYRKVLCREGQPEHNQLALIVFTVVDEEGRLIFSPDDIPLLESLDSAITTRLYQAALEHCTYEEGDDLGNSPRTPTACSP